MHLSASFHEIAFSESYDANAKKIERLCLDPLRALLSRLLSSIRSLFAIQKRRDLE